jgi:leucyl/phenylalanyl-tRNA---protein transferase
VVTSHFPDPRYARGDIVALGDTLSVDILRDAYRHGIFPWPHEGLPLPWFSPRRRALLFFDEMHIGRTLQKARKSAQFRFTVDQSFQDVIRACSEAPRPGQDGTWISDEIVDAYVQFHHAGGAHSVEVWDGEELVGGLYGVDAGGAFTGESMFHRAPNASKLALLFLIDRLREHGIKWIDCQVMTPHMRALGAREVSRPKFLDLLAAAQSKGSSSIATFLRSGTSRENSGQD